MRPVNRRRRAGERGQVHFRQPRAPNSYNIASVVPTHSRHRCRNAVHMARQPRLDLPGIPQHIVQRGNNRLPCFLDDTDRACYRQLLREALLATGCKLHANVLMDNHVHLLATPPEVGATGRMMQQLGRRYVGQFNARDARTGTLWEGRFKAYLVDSDEYLLRCSRYIDLNPVRARMTDDPAAFPWSSCAGLCGLRDDLLLSAHPVQHALGAPLYRAMLAEAISAKTWPRSGSTCSSNAPTAATTFARWTKRRPSASPAFGRHIGRPDQGTRPGK